MAVRKTLQKNRIAVAVCVILVTVLCIAIIHSEVKSPLNLSAIGKTFYSDDDGKTWFLDDPANGSPFERQGRKAYRVLVCRCAGGAPFVAYLAKFSDRQIAQDAAEMSHAPPGTPSRLAGMTMQDIKKPAELTWTSNTTPSMNGYPPVTCPGGGDAEMVLPTDRDTGATN